MIPVKVVNTAEAVMCGSSQQLTFTKDKFLMVYDPQTFMMSITEKKSNEEVIIFPTIIKWFKPLKNDKPVK